VSRSKRYEPTRTCEHDTCEHVRVCGTQGNHFALCEFYTNTHTWMRHIQRARTPICSCGLSDSYNHDCDMFEFWNRVFQFGTCSITSCIYPPSILPPCRSLLQDRGQNYAVTYFPNSCTFVPDDHSHCISYVWPILLHTFGDCLDIDLADVKRLTRLLMGSSPLQFHWKPTCFLPLVLQEEGRFWEDGTAHVMEWYLSISQTNMNKSCLIFEYVIPHTRLTMGWLRLVGSIK